jgi:hypothetical protein
MSIEDSPSTIHSGEPPADAAGQRDAEGVAFAEPEVAQPEGRPRGRHVVRRIGHGSVDHVLHAGTFEKRHPFRRRLEVGQQLVEFVREQLLAERGRNAIDEDRRPLFLVGAHRQSHALLTHVEGAFGIAHHRKLGQPRLLALDRLGDCVGHDEFMDEIGVYWNEAD